VHLAMARWQRQTQGLTVILFELNPS